MPVSDNLFLHNFRSEMDVLEQRCSESNERVLNDLHDIFRDTDDGLFGYLSTAPFTGYDSVRAVMPTWASDEIRQNSTGAFSFHQHLLDATWFWRTVRTQFERLTGKNVRGANVVDYGAGWGRISRFANKDVSARQFFALEPNPVFREIYVNCRLPGTLIDIGWMSETQKDLPIIDLIFSYSILTHSSEELTKNIVDRWFEMTRPGSVIAFTVRPGCYHQAIGGDMSIFDSKERANFDKIHESGELYYKGYPGSKHWGVTVMSEKYLDMIFGRKFKVVHKSYQLQTENQLIVFAVRI